MPRFYITATRIYFKDINLATKLAGFEDLRKTRLDEGDIEIRVWRGNGLEPLEGFILNRNRHIWRAYHLKTDKGSDYKQVYVRWLRAPKSGWNSFWEQINDKGILTIHTQSELECNISRFLDGSGYVVEINQNKTYLTYQYSDGGTCIEAKRMEEIGDIIAEEFYSENEKCKRVEWFDCAQIRKSYKQKTR